MATNDRKAVGAGWLCTHLICCAYGLSLVPGYGYLLLTVVGFAALSFFFIRNLASKKAFSAAFALAMVIGYAIRKMTYEESGLTASSLLLTLLVVATAVCVGYFVFSKEKVLATD